MSLELKLDRLAEAVEALVKTIAERAALVQITAQSQVPAAAVAASPPPAAANAPAPASLSEKPVEAAKPATTAHQAPAASAAPASPDLGKEARTVTTDLASIGPGELGRAAAIELLAQFGAKKAGEVAQSVLPTFIAQVKAKAVQLRTTVGA